MATNPFSPEAIAYYHQLDLNNQMANTSFNGVPLDAAGLIAHLPNDVRGIFDQARNAAASGSPWTPDRFQSALIGTAWWKQTAPTAREYMWSHIIDPANATQQSNQVAFRILQMAGNMGRPMSLAQAAHMADQYIMGGWSDQVLQYQLSTQALGAGQHWGPGGVNTAKNQITKTAADYGISVAPATIQSWGQRIAGGMTDQSAFTDYAIQQAKVNHPYWAKQINEGATVRQLADPYIQQAARLLEITPDSVSLTDPKWNFTQHDQHGVTPMSQLDWQKKLMTDPAYKWDQTQNAHESAFQMVDQIKQNFGAK